MVKVVQVILSFQGSSNYVPIMKRDAIGENNVLI